MQKISLKTPLEVLLEVDVENKVCYVTQAHDLSFLRGWEIVHQPKIPLKIGMAWLTECTLLQETFTNNTGSFQLLSHNPQFLPIRPSALKPGGDGEFKQAATLLVKGPGGFSLAYVKKGRGTIIVEHDVQADSFCFLTNSAAEKGVKTTRFLGEVGGITPEKHPTIEQGVVTMTLAGDISLRDVKDLKDKLNS
jgi:hypothetical protein